MPIIRLNINGQEVNGHEGQTILEAANAAGIQIPTLCHDERVQVYGSCGICVVEAEGVPKLLRSCSTLVADGMIINTNSERVKNSRKTALELLLSDHTGDCRPPCALACPGQTDCQGYVGLIANGEYREAFALIKDKIPLPAAIGRVCPHPCETACRRALVEEAIDIAHLKHFVADRFLFSDEAYNTEILPDTGKKIAVVGGGPGGLSAAYYLRKKGHDITVYEAMPKMGGMLQYGIPEYRLPKAVLDKEISHIERLGIKFANDVKIGRDLTLDYLMNSFDSTVIAIGAWTSMGLRCEGEDLRGVIGGIDFLREVDLNNPFLLGKRVVVVGGGNTAMDACRCAVRLGADVVYNVYRRTKAEMPAEQIEIEEAEEEGVIFKNLANPIEIIGDNGKVNAVRLQIMELGDEDASGRRSPVPVAGMEETIQADTVIIAIGQGVDAAGFDEIALTKWKTLLADEETFETNIKGVFAVGDATNKGADIAISAIGEAKRAADVIDSYLNGEIIPHKKPYLVTSEATKEMVVHHEKKPRVQMRHLCPAERKDNFKQVNKGLSEEEAVREAKRCLECGCHDYFECKLIKESNNYNVSPEKFGGEIHNRPVADDHPFIKINLDKCILCGLCVRVCDEVMGITALGLVDRGFDTVVRPALNMPLKETDCISCGQCVNLCPTGALLEITPTDKQVPVDENINKMPCSYCSLGCPTKTTFIGNSVLRSLPDETADPQALLCAKGRFGIANPIVREKARLTKPLIRKNGVLTECGFEEAFIYITEKMQGISSVYGANSLAVSVSDKLSNEEIFAVKKYANDVLKTDNVFSFNLIESGLKEVFGYDASTSGMNDLMNADLIFVVEDNIFKSHTIAAVKIRQCVQKGAKLITLNNSVTYLNEYADVELSAGEGLSVLKQFMKALIDMGLEPNNTEGFQELKQYLSGIEKPDNQIEKAAQLYANARNAIIVFEQNAFSADAAKLIASISLISGHIANPDNGIISLKPNVNSQGLADMGVASFADGHKERIERGITKALLIFGEDIADIDLSKLEFLMAAEVYMTQTAEKAEVLLPLSNLYESGGSVTNTFRKFRKFNKTVSPACGLTNIEIIKQLANCSTEKLTYNNEADLLERISQTIPGYKPVFAAQKPVFISRTDSPVLYGDGYGFDNKMARIVIPQSDIMYERVKNTHANFTNFNLFMKECKLQPEVKR